MNKIIVGLGNPGTKYKYSRHNLGFLVLDELSKLLKVNKWKESTRFDAKYFINNESGTLFIKPLTFMNASGTSVSKAMKYYDIKPESLIVIHDDLDLEFLHLKKQFEAGAAGHHGVEDIVEKLGTKKFWRIRVGIGRPQNIKYDTSEWVLGNFTTSELEKLSDMTLDIADLIK